MLYLSAFKSALDKIRKVCYNPTISERNNFSKAFSSLTKNQIPKGGVCLWVYLNPVYLRLQKK